MAKKTAPAKTENKQPTRVMRTLSPFEDFDRFFEGMFPRGLMRSHFDWPAWGELGSSLEGRVPKMDVIDRDKEIVVRAEVPGVDKKDLDVTMTDTSVTIKGSTKEEHQEEKGDYHRSEIRQGAFARTMPLPCEVDSDKAKATFKDGILELTIPKVERAHKRTVNVE